MSIEEMVIELSVAKVDFGGNTGEAKQFYFAFDQNTCILKKLNTKLKIKFSKSTSKKFLMEKLIFEGSQQTLVACDSNKSKSRELCCTNVSEKVSMVNFSVLCSYEGDLLSCDPQVLNDPETGPG